MTTTAVGCGLPPWGSFAKLISPGSFPAPLSVVYGSRSSDQDGHGNMLDNLIIVMGNECWGYIAFRAKEWGLGCLP